MPVDKQSQTSYTKDSTNFHLEIFMHSSISQRTTPTNNNQTNMQNQNLLDRLIAAVLAGRVEIEEREEREEEIVYEEPVLEPLAEPALEPVAEPALEPVAEPALEPAAEPVVVQQPAPLEAIVPIAPAPLEALLGAIDMGLPDREELVRRRREKRTRQRRAQRLHRKLEEKIDRIYAARDEMTEEELEEEYRMIEEKVMEPIRPRRVVRPEPAEPEPEPEDELEDEPEPLALEPAVPALVDPVDSQRYLP